MSDSTATLRRKMGRAVSLQSVVRTMKAMAASSISQYEQSVRALAVYCRDAELGLGACFRAEEPPPPPLAAPRETAEKPLDAIVFGSDQGLVGPFNDHIAEFTVKALAGREGRPRVWAVGERVHARLADAGLRPRGLLAVPNSVNGIPPLIDQILMEREARRDGAEDVALHLFHNSPKTGAAYEPVRRILLPLDEAWRRNLARQPWPTRQLPDVTGEPVATLRAFIREYLFASLFRACAESLASENASRLAAMDRAEKNIGDMLETLQFTFHQVRQSAIDEELFDVVSGFEALIGQGDLR